VQDKLSDQAFVLREERSVTSDKVALKQKSWPLSQINKDIYIEQIRRAWLSKPIVAALLESGFSEPTEIQIGTIQLILQGKMFLLLRKPVQAKQRIRVTIIDCLDEPDEKPRALIMVPTESWHCRSPLNSSCLAVTVN